MGTKNLFDLSGKTALITGASRGIGKAIAQQLAFHGANVVVSSRKQDACDAVTNSINEETNDANRATTIVCNISYKEQLQHLVDQTTAKYGKIDILICNAAVNPYFGSILNIEDSAYDKIIGSNVRSNHWLCNMVIPQMRERKDGAIVVISSIGGLKGSAVLGAYGISKAADLQLVRNLATEFGPDNIRVNGLCPGLIKTDFAKALWDNPEILKASTAGTPLRRIGESDEIAGAVVYLASSAGNFTTGHALVIDGGSTIC